jgi:copper transport protein
VNAVLTTAPSTLRLWFSEPVDAPADAIVVFDPWGVRVDLGDSRRAADDRLALEASLRATARGTYVVRWTAISADSHPIAGSFRFSIGEPGPAAEIAAGGGTPDTTLLAAQAAVRWAHLTALTLVCGPLFLWPMLPAAWHRQEVLSSLWRLVVAGALSLFIVAVASLIVQAVAVGSSMARGLSRPALTTLLQTRWGTLWGVRVLLALTAFALAVAAKRSSFGAPSERRLRRAVIAIGVALLAATALNGHAAATPPVWLSLGVDWIHLAAMTAWLGGLLTLAIVILPVARAASGPAPLDLSPVVRRFSALAIGCVAALCVTGGYQAWTYVGTLDAAVATGYGRTLLLKVGLVFVMLMPAAFHLLVVRRWQMDARAGATAGRLRMFQRTLAIETAGGVALLAAVGLLTSQPAARARALAASAVSTATAATPARGVTLYAQGPSTHVSLALTPGRVGSNRIDVQISDRSGQNIAGAEARFRIVPPAGAQISPWTVVPARRDDGTHSATVALTPGGDWRLVVTVSLPAGQAEAVEFDVPLPVQPAGRSQGP